MYIALFYVVFIIAYFCILCLVYGVAFNNNIIPFVNIDMKGVRLDLREEIANSDNEFEAAIIIFRFIAILLLGIVVAAVVGIFWPVTLLAGLFLLAGRVIREHVRKDK